MSSNYPGGFLNGLIVRGVPITQLHPGEVFWVNNSSVLAKGGIGGSNANDGSYRKPWSTIDYAVGRCTAARGDIIAVMPGHAETYSTDATAVTADLVVDVEGVAIVGLGSGSLRPTITQDTTVEQTIQITAANVMLYNIYFKADFANIKIGITLTTAKYFSLVKCHFEDESNAKCWLNVMESTGAANTVDGLLVMDNVLHGLDPSFNTFCDIGAAQDGLDFIGNRIGTESTSDVPVLLDLTGDSLNLWMNNNSVNTLAATAATVLVQSSGTAGTGMLVSNYCFSRAAAGDSYVGAAGFRGAVMYHGGVEATQAALIDPVLDT